MPSYVRDFLMAISIAWEPVRLYITLVEFIFNVGYILYWQTCS